MLDGGQGAQLASSRRRGARGPRKKVKGEGGGQGGRGEDKEEGAALIIVICHERTLLVLDRDRSWREAVRKTFSNR